MGKAKHTPGPWSYCGVQAKDPCPCGFVFGDGGQVYVAKALSLSDEVDPVADASTRHANTKLIAAAPELADALE